MRGEAAAVSEYDDGYNAGWADMLAELSGERGTRQGEAAAAIQEAEAILHIALTDDELSNYWLGYYHARAAARQWWNERRR